jgi:endonuclease YncB( thermonuclease family)
MFKRIFIYLFLFNFLLHGLAFSWDAKVVGVSDGDTITVLSADEKRTKIRLYGIDCPEKHQAFGQKAKKFTSDMVFGKSVEIKSVTTDRYGRTVAWVSMSGHKGPTLNEELLQAGLAWHYKKYSTDQTLGIHEQYAKGEKIGLWSDPNPIPPWDFRRGVVSIANVPMPAPKVKTYSPPRASSTSRHYGTSIITTPTNRHYEIAPSAQSASNSIDSGPFHGNNDSFIFHSSDCRFFNCNTCTEYFVTRQEAMSAGYSPCKICNP